MIDRVKIMVAGQALASRIAAELKDDYDVVGIDLSRSHDEPVIHMSVPETYPEAPVYHSKPWVQSHPTSPKPSKPRPMKKGKHK